MRARTKILTTLLTIIVALGLSGTATHATTQCDTDPNAVRFQPTVDSTLLNDLLSSTGQIDILGGDFNVDFPGLCTDHRMTASAGVFGLPVVGAPFNVTPSNGAIQVDLMLPGLEVGLGIDHRSVNCASLCVIDIPYIGEVFNGCDIEGAIVGTVVELVDASVQWDGITITQVADTCVLGDCSAVHPLERSTTSVGNMDIDLTGFGSCEVCIGFEDLLNLGCLDPCQGIDPFLEAAFSGLIAPVIESVVNSTFVDNQGKGMLIEVFSRDIVKDGCADVPEVLECLDTQPSASESGRSRGSKSAALNALLWGVPLALFGGLALRLRRSRNAP